LGTPAILNTQEVETEGHCSRLGQTKVKHNQAWWQIL
jgi:hypothetical protein